MPKYPITVDLCGVDGNAFCILGHVLSSMRRAHIPQEERETFKKQATSGDYNHLIATCMDWVDIKI